MLRFVLKAVKDGVGLASDWMQAAANGNLSQYGVVQTHNSSFVATYLVVKCLCKK